MPQWMWFAPLGLLILALGLWGFRLGWIAATITETDVIETYTAHYLQTQGATARATDCSARPAPDNDVWIVVRCAAASGARFEYPVDRWGRLVQPAPARGPVHTPEI